MSKPILAQNDKYRIVQFDEYNLVLEEHKLIEIRLKGVKTGETRMQWVHLGFYGNLTAALRRLVALGTVDALKTMPAALEQLDSLIISHAENILENLKTKV